MSNIQVFNYQSHEVRTVEQDGEPWFVLKDVCKVLGLTTPARVAERLDSDEVSLTHLTDSMGRQQETTVINESGLYNVILRSDKPEAKPFRKWVTSEVLPSIRKTGGYIAGQESMSDSELMAKALLVAKRQIDAKTAQIEEMTPKAVFADAVAASKTSILIGELAKILRQNGVEDMGQQRLFEWMRNNGFLIRRKATDRNMPTQRAIEQGLMEVKETTICHSDGHTSISKTPKVTGKGQVYFVNRLAGKQSSETKE